MDESDTTSEPNAQPGLRRRNPKTRILFSFHDFKSRCWGVELERDGCEIILPKNLRLPYLGTVFQFAHPIFKTSISGQKVHAFIFRYLNDRKALHRSLRILLRDLVTVLVCLLFKVKIIWIIHNIDRESKHYHPLLSRIRRKVVGKAAKKVLVTDPALVSFGVRCGIASHKLGWTCFGTIPKKQYDPRNQFLKDQILTFKSAIRELGIKTLYCGLCVSGNEPKKAHYLYADSIVGRCGAQHDSCVVLVLIGKHPEGSQFAAAKERARACPYILLIEEAFPVMEDLLADEIDFFYRSLTDYSMPYSLYVSCGLKKPMITHNCGALPSILAGEKLGFTIRDGVEDIPGFIVDSIQTWSPDNADAFMQKRTWKIGAEQIFRAIQTKKGASRNVIEFCEKN